MAKSCIPLTLIVPVHNRQKQLERTLASLIEQDVLPEEVIVVDDHSKPAVTVCPQDFPGLRITLMRHGTNRGAAAARNTGLRSSKTEWVSFLDSDDILVSNTLGERWRLMQKDQARKSDPRCIYGCSWIDISEAGLPLQLRKPNPSRSVSDFAGGCWFSPGSCILLNRAAAVEAAGYQDEAIRRLEDFDWFLSLALKGFHFRLQPATGVHIERRRSQKPEIVAQNAQILQLKWRSALADPKLLARIEGYLSLEVAAAFHFAGNHFKAAYWLGRSFTRKFRFSLHLHPGWKVERHRTNR